MLRKKGRYVSQRAYAQAIANALRAELGGTHRAAKQVMSWTNVSERTAKFWLAGVYGPRGNHLVTLLRYSDGALDVVLGLADRKPIIASERLKRARDAMAAAARYIDENT